MCALCPHPHSLHSLTSLTHFTCQQIAHFISLHPFSSYNSIPSKIEQIKPDAALTLSPSSSLPFLSIHIIHSRALHSQKTRHHAIDQCPVSSLHLPHLVHPSIDASHPVCLQKYLQIRTFPSSFWTLFNYTNCGFFFYFQYMLANLRRSAIGPSTPPPPDLQTCPPSLVWVKKKSLSITLE